MCPFPSTCQLRICPLHSHPRATHPPTHPPATRADVPGLLEGAHAGVGLGHQFLRHCQRCRLLVHVVDGTSPDPVGDYIAIRQELELFNPALAVKPQVGGRTDEGGAEWGEGGGLVEHGDWGQECSLSPIFSHCRLDSTGSLPAGPLRAPPPGGCLQQDGCARLLRLLGGCAGAAGCCGGASGQLLCHKVSGVVGRLQCAL